MAETHGSSDRTGDGATDVKTRPTGDGPSEDEATGTAEIPGPDGLPLVGSTIAAARDGVGFSRDLAGYGDVASYRMFGREFVAVFDPEVVETVLVSRNEQFRKGEFETGAGEMVAPTGLAFTEGEQWERQRTLLQPMFTPARIQGYADAAVEETERLVAGWDDGETVELSTAFGRLTLRILARTLFDVGLDDARGDVVRRAANAVQEQLSLGASMLLPPWIPTPARRRYERAMEDLDALVDELLADARDGDRASDDLLSLLATASYPDGTDLPRSEVRDQLVTFLFAGHETTALGLTHAVRALVDAPHARERLESELGETLGGDRPAFEDLSQLPFLDAVTDEALRLYPPVYAVYREPTSPTTLAGYEVTPDQTLQLSTFNVHRDERWYDDPERFRPGRWLDDVDRPEYAFLPFGGGPRHCIGMRFARMELRLALATLVRRVRFELLDDPGLSMELLLRPAGDVRARVRKR